MYLGFRHSLLLETGNDTVSVMANNTQLLILPLPSDKANLVLGGGSAFCFFCAVILLTLVIKANVRREFPGARKALILSQICSDTLYCLTFMVHQFISYSEEFVTRLTCQLWYSAILFHILITFTTFLQLCLSMEMLVWLRHPSVHCKSVTGIRAVCVITLLLVIAVLLRTSQITQHVAYNTASHSCHQKTMLAAEHLAIGATTLIIYLLPAIAAIGLNEFLLYFLRSSRTLGFRESQETYRQIYPLTVVAIIQVIFTFPATFFYAYDHLGGSVPDHTTEWQQFLLLLPGVSPPLTLVVFVSCYRPVRHQFARLLHTTTCHLCRRRCASCGPSFTTVSLTSLENHHDVFMLSHGVAEIIHSTLVSNWSFTLGYLKIPESFLTQVGQDLPGRGQFLLKLTRIKVSMSVLERVYTRLKGQIETVTENCELQGEFGDVNLLYQRAKVIQAELCSIQRDIGRLIQEIYAEEQRLNELNSEENDAATTDVRQKRYRKRREMPLTFTANHLIPSRNNMNVIYHKESNIIPNTKI